MKKKSLTAFALLIFFVKSQIIYGQIISGYDIPPATISSQTISCEYISGVPVFTRDGNENPLNDKTYYCINDIQKITYKDLRAKFYGQYKSVGRFNNGKQHGTWKTYFGYDKIVKIINYKEGLVYGNYKVFDVNNLLLYSTSFTNGNGLYKDFYHESGNIKIEGYYQNGKRHGIWKIYDWEGGLVKIIKFENGNPIY